VSVPEIIAEQDARLIALARGLIERTGSGRIQGITRLAGGRNNRVYRVDIENGPSLVLKRYFSDVRDTRDRLGAEWNFINHAWSHGIRAVPEPLACDASERAGLYGFVQGRKLGASEVMLTHVDAAADFLLAVNEGPRPVLAAASEACFSLAEHIATVDRRVARLTALDPDAPYLDEAQSFVSGQLMPAWIHVKSCLATKARAAGLAIDKPIGADECCLSPSDFGFHNALLDGEGHLTFLDFEYAGVDDPAKLVSDFFCQPEVPVPLACHVRFVDRLAKGLRLDAPTIARCRILLDAYRIKWTCIILNDFVALDSARRAFASDADRALRCAGQLAKASSKMAEIEASIP
jgi:hypothetical protein